MSNEGFRNVPGVPDGWELVRVGQPVYNVDHMVDPDGNPKLCDFDSSYLNRVIIRKIEQPAKYRPFANGAEFTLDERDRVGVDWKKDDASPGYFAVVSANSSFVWVAFGDAIKRFGWDQAFEKLKFRHLDGSTSPFGVKIDE